MESNTPGAFTYNSSCTVLSPGVPCVIDVIFDPEYEGYYGGTLIASGGGETQTVSLTGKGGTSESSSDDESSSCFIDGLTE